MSYSPWGKIQRVVKIETGVSFVHTAGHGGVRVSKGKAKLLSKHALKHAIIQSNYVFFEEDCALSVFFWERQDLIPVVNQAGWNLTKEKLHSSLSRWTPDYLLAVGETPNENQFSEWRANRLSEKMRAEKHPDLIVCAWGEGDRCKVKTADGKTHYVTTESYNYHNTPNLLSNCKKA